MAPPEHLKPWLSHVKKLQKEHPKMMWKNLLQKASKTYKAKSKPAAKKTPKQKTPKQKTYPNGRPYLYGRAWHVDRHKFNKNEEWEVPPNQRKTALW